MKKIPIYSLIFAFLFSLIFPGQAVFAMGPVAPQAAAQTVELSPPPVLIKVVSVVPAQSILVNQAAVSLPPVLSCSFSARTGTNLVQDTGLINLNQPANCFSFVTPRPQNQPQLAVQKLPALQPTIVILNQPLAIKAPSLASAPVAQSSPMLPLTASVLAAGFVFGKRRLVLAALNPRQALTKVFRPNQLQVLRC